ncbi:MAG: SdrD B-like domain-containing protein [Bacteroidia bacterium]
MPASSGLARIGDFVWNDLNQNGVQDSGEPGIAGVTIAFTNGSLSGTTTTNGDGNYAIPSLLAGSYTLTMSLPGNFPFLVGQNQGLDATKDSDFDPTTFQTTVVLAAGVDNNDTDAGLSAAPVCPTITFGSSSNNENCPGANDGMITLTGPSGGTAPYMFSADSGMTYVSGGSFSNLGPGVYQMRVMDSDGCESDAVAVTVAAGVDNTNPMITCPAAQTVLLGANCDAILGSYSAAAVSDNCTSNPAVSQSPAPMPISTNTSVTLTATDASGNAASCSFMVMVSDTSSPSLTGASALVMRLVSSADATITESDPNNNVGGNDYVHTGSSNGNQKRRGLFRFDIAGSIPAGATIDSVKFNLFLPSGNSSNPSDFDLFASLKDWDEGNKTGNTGSAASSGEVTWNSNFHNSSTWAAPGGQAGTDYTNTASATTNVSGSGTYTWTGMQADVQRWLNNPGRNFGWFLISQSENVGGTARRFVSKENTTLAQPELEVYYSLPGTDICGTTDTMVVDTSCNVIVMDYVSNAVAWDNCGTPVRLPKALRPVPCLLPGRILVTLTATDASGNTGNCSFTIEVLDNIAPEIVCPADQVVIADTSGTGLLGTYAAASATDNCGNPTVMQSPAAGTLITANTAITLTATDASGNSTDCNFMVLLDTISISIDPLKAALRIQAYPNPTNGLVTIQVEGATNQPIHAALYDVHGRLFLRKASQTSSFELDLSSFAEGLYFLRIENGSNVYGWEKLVVE